MANVKNSKILKIYWTRRPYGRGAGPEGSYFDYFLEDIIDDIIIQDKIKDFIKLWKKKIAEKDPQKTLI